MLNQDGITDNIRAQEEEYFRRKDRELIENLRRADAAARKRLALAEETGIQDPALLSELAHLGFTPETIPLILLVPILRVAWAKAGVSTPERRLIVNFARSRGIGAGSAADRKLKEWLDTKPSEDTFHKAMRLICAMIDAPEHRVNVDAHELLDYCEKIAHASGGIFGIGAVSQEEREAVREIAERLKHN